jgi:hypothetical protein
MEYETVEQKLSEVNAYITSLNNEIVKLTWIDKDFNKSRAKGDLSCMVAEKVLFIKK